MDFTNRILFLIFFNLLLVSVVSAAAPDSDNNGCVSLGEISSYVNLWLQGNITLSQVSSGVSWWLGGCITPTTGNIIINHTSSSKFTTIPACWINKAKQDLHIAHSHTSHGSQIQTGMRAIRDYNNFYNYSANGGVGTLHYEDYGSNGFGTGLCYDLSTCDDGGEGILAPTRQFLNSPQGQDINVIMWSWCAIINHDIAFYIDKMKTLIIEYENGSALHPTPVKFVFMTGHADGQGEYNYTSVTYYQNKLVRAFIYNESPNAFCKHHQCILYDFGDMEDYDPDGNYYVNRGVQDNLNYNNPSGNWGVDYLNRYPTGMDADLTDIIYTYGIYPCAHSDNPYDAMVNCALKGKSAWYMYARLAGWDGVSQTCN